MPAVTATLSRALKAAVGLRDKVVVVRLDPRAKSPVQLDEFEAMGEFLSLLRSLDVRVIVVFGAGSQGPTDAVADAPADAPALSPAAVTRLQAAVLRHGQKAVSLLSSGVISSPLLIDQVLLTQLCMLRYIPILILPVLDGTGRTLHLSADEVGVAIGKYMDAALLVFVRGDDAAVPLPLGIGSRRTLVTTATNAEQLFFDIFEANP
jgi:hypothetical protein